MPTRVLESYICCRCGEGKPRDAYGTRASSNGRRYRLTRCKACEVKRVAEKAIRNPLTKIARRQRSAATQYARVKQERRERVRVERFILWDSRKIDKKLGRRNDLTLDVVCDLISAGCSYCGETQLRMGLDRIDNDIGHVVANVIGACVRCNLMRRHMPYKAWMLLVPAIRAARLSGAFGDWTGEIHRTSEYIRESDEVRINSLLEAKRTSE